MKSILWRFLVILMLVKQLLKPRKVYFETELLSPHYIYSCDVMTEDDSVITVSKLVAV